MSVLSAADPGQWSVAESIAKSLFDTGPAGVAIFVLLIVCGGLGYIVLQQTKTILSIKEMTIETDRQVASSLSSIGSQLGVIQHILSYNSHNGGNHVS